MATPDDPAYEKSPTSDLPGLTRHPGDGADRITLSDLCVLVAGCAIALASVKYRTDFNAALASSGPIWYVVKAGEFFEKAAIALLVVILNRRRRIGGSLRSAEWLLVAIAMRAAGSLRIMSDAREELGYRLFNNPYDDRAAWAWAYLGSALFVISLVGFIREGRTLSRVAILSLACLVMLTVFWGPGELNVLTVRSVWRRSFTFPPHSSFVRYGFPVFSRLLERVLIGIPLLAMLRRGEKSDREVVRWPGQAGVLVTILILLTELASRLYPWPFQGSFEAAIPRFALWALGWALSLILSWTILILFGPTIGRSPDSITGRDRPQPGAMTPRVTSLNEILSI